MSDFARHFIATSLACFSAILLGCTSGQLCLAQDGVGCIGRARLNSYERGQFVAVSLGQEAEVYEQVLASPGCGSAMLDSLRQLGGSIRYSDAKSGYALLLIPREKLLSTLDVEGIAYAYTRDDLVYNEDPAAKIPQQDRTAEPVPQIAIPNSRVAKVLPKDGPYFAADEAGLTELWKEHPEADGRGVRVAVSDVGFDLLHPALQEAKDANGNVIPKVADLGTLTSPDEDSSWVRFGDAIQAKRGVFEAAGRTWATPEDVVYHFGIFNQNLTLGPKDNSHSQKLSLSVGVLWDPGSNRVWVDTDGDGSFKNQRALGDYGTTHDVDWFGAKTGNNDNRIPFGVKIDPAQQSVYIRIGGDHGAFVAGPLAANEMTGGLFNGAAPGAQLIDSNSNLNLAGIVEMFARPDVDVVNRSGGIARAGRIGKRGESEDFARHVLERLVAVYNKPMACYCSAAGTILVDDYTGREMLRRNRQLAPPYGDTINGGVDFLASGLVNLVLAPSANLDTESRYDPLDLLWRDGKKHSYADDSFDPPAPDGYVIGANNSPTIPVVSGVFADLISEARREHVRYNATRLNNAIFTGARLLEGFPISQQGYGLVNAAESWKQLAKMAKADDAANPELTSFSVSREEGRKSEEVQGFYTDLDRPGDKVDGEIWITRHGGFAGGRKYTFSLRGNDGGFDLLDHQATLERDKPVKIRFRSTGAPGWDMVFLELRDVRARVVMRDVPISVRVPDSPREIGRGVDRYESTIPPLHSEYRYPRVGNEVQAVRYVMKIPYIGSCCSSRFLPGAHYRGGITPPGQPLDADHHVGPMEKIESLTANDAPGMQEIFWENSGRPEYATQYDDPAPDVSIHAELTVTKYAVAIQGGESGTLTVNNKLAAIEGTTELYDATLKTDHLTGSGLHASGEISESLPPNLIQWRVRVTPDSASSGPADVYLLNCSGKDSCRISAQQEIETAGQTVAIDRPQAGDWKIVVRSRGQVAHQVTSTILEAFLFASQTPIEQAGAKRLDGATWTIPLPAKRSDARYAAFRIAGTSGVESERNDLVIAMTPLDPNAP